MEAWYPALPALRLPNLWRLLKIFLTMLMNWILSPSRTRHLSSSCQLHQTKFWEKFKTSVTPLAGTMPLTSQHLLIWSSLHLTRLCLQSLLTGVGLGKIKMFWKLSSWVQQVMGIWLLVKGSELKIIGVIKCLEAIQRTKKMPRFGHSKIFYNLSAGNPNVYIGKETLMDARLVFPMRKGWPLQGQVNKW